MKYRSTPEALRGSIAPLITPFTQDGDIDLNALGRLAEWQIGEGSHGISVGGSSGEFITQTLEERREVMTVAAESAGDRVVFMPGTGANTLRETIELTAFAHGIGADAILLIVPYYSRPSQENLLAYFSTVAGEFADLPIVVYNIPGRTGTNIAPETLAQLRSKQPNIVGVKESNKDFEHISKVIHSCGSDFLVYSGIELLCYPMLTIGGAGHLSATANLLPGELARLYDLTTTGKWDDARRLHYELLPLNEVLFVETNPGPVKWAMERVGLLPCGRPRSPLDYPSEPHRQAIESVLCRYPALDRRLGRTVSA